MANYENGVFTRQTIIQACKQLFYEKGYHETSYSDICKAAHVNRSTIYYHFETKEVMRYEVMWEYTNTNKHVAEKYCNRTEYHYILAMYIIWYQVKTDERIRRFYLSESIDYPILTGKIDCSHYYTLLYERMWEPFFEKKKIPDLSFTSVYGYIISCMRMFCEHPEKYDLMEMFTHCVNASVSIWGIPQKTIEQVWQDIKYYISLIPGEEMTVK